jgi:diguanylate cyclase (GGDEF)-like protein
VRAYGKAFRRAIPRQRDEKGAQPAEESEVVRRFGDLSLTTRFAVVSVVPLILIGLILGRFFEGHIRDRALAGSERAAVVVATSLRPALSESDLSRGLDATARGRVDELRKSLKAAGVSAIRVADSHGQIVYADSPELSGRHLPLSGELGDALGGHVSSRLMAPPGGPKDTERYRRVFQVYAPIYQSGEISGILQLNFRFHSIAEAIASDTRQMHLLLLGSFALLYAALLPTVAAASRRLRRQARQNRFLALHDHLTRLPNRLLFDDRVEQAIRAAKRDRGTLAIALLDIDRFKEINDTLGHRTGDDLLKEVSRRFRGVLRQSDTIARLGGDEFAFLLPEASYGGSVVEIATRIQKALAEPFVLEGLPLELEASIGITLYPQHGDDVTTLLRRADVAMYLAKRARSGYALYSFEHDEYNPQRLALVGELRRAIEQRELVVHYQPKARLHDGTVDSAEALVRWSHPTSGLLAPEDFIPVAEHTGLIDALTTYVLEDALRQCRAWRDEGQEIAVSVNVATRNLLDGNFPSQVAELLDRYGIEPEALELEITESSVLADPPRATRALIKLSEMGVKLSVDDFGTGYSSFTYLSQLPVDKIKIDKSFVLVMADDEQGAAIVRSTIDVGRNLSLEVIAEGVETAEVWETLAALGCDSAQGFYLSRPMTGEALTDWLTESGLGAGALERRRAS